MSRRRPIWLDDLRPLSLAAAGASAAVTSDAFLDFGIPGAEVKASLPFGVLRTFAPLDQPPARQVLVVAPLAGGYPLLMRDLVVALLARGNGVAITDWPNVRHVPLARGPFGFADNCIEVAQMIRALGPNVHVVGVCQGVVPALVASLLLADEAEAPASLSLLGGPVDPSRNPTRLWQVLQQRALGDLERDLLETVPVVEAGAGRRVFPAWRQMETFGLYLWRQTVSGRELPWRLTFDEGADPMRFPLARLCWTMMDVPGEFFMENVATIFRENALAHGTLRVAGRLVEARAMTRTALCCVEGEADDIAAPGQTAAAHDLCTGVPAELRASVTVPHAGHFSLFYGTAMRRTVVPALEAIMGRAEAARGLGKGA